MKTVYLLLAVFLLSHLQSSAQTWEWTHPEPNGIENTNSNPYLGDETDDAHDVETDPSGNVYVLGDFNDSLYLNNIFRESGVGSYLAKYDSTGNLLWYKSIVPTQYDDVHQKIKATDLTVNAQGVFITGNYFGSYFTSYDCTTGINTGVSFSYKIGGLNFTSARNDLGLFITKFNASGNVVWNKTATEDVCANGGAPGFGSLNYNPFITSDKNNNIIVSFALSDFRPSMKIGGDVIPLNGDYYNSGRFLVVVKYNPNGIFQWSNYAGGLNSGAIYYPNSMIADNTRAIYFQGAANDSCFFGNQLFRFSDANTIATYFAKISSAGTWQFVKELTNQQSYSAELSIGNSAYLAADISNNIYALVNASIQNDTVNIGGLKIAPGIGVANTFIVKLDNNGNTRWVKNFGMGQAAQAYGVENNASGIYYSGNNLYITGSLRNYWPVSYNFSKLYVPSTVCGQGMLNSFVAKADTSADFKWATTFCGAFNNQNFDVAVSGNNVYTCGYYTSGVDGLGNLNGYFISSGQEHNSFLGKLKDQYIRVSAISPTSLIPGCTITVPFTSTGLTLTAGNTFTAELSNANGDFTTTTAIGSTTSTGTGSITATIPASLIYSSGYRVRIRSSDTLKTGFNYYAYADTGYKLTLVCPPPSAGFTATNITGTTATVNWTAVGCAAGYKVQYRVKGTTAWTTKSFNGNTPTLNITGLALNTIYQWKVASKCINISTSSFSPYSAIKTFTTAAAIAASNAVDLSTASSNALKILLQPNPAKTNTTLVINGTVKNASITITDFVGKTIWKKDGINSNQIKLPVQNFAAGMYIVKLTNGNETKVTKLVKE